MRDQRHLAPSTAERLRRASAATQHAGTPRRGADARRRAERAARGSDAVRRPSAAAARAAIYRDVTRRAPRSPSSAHAGAPPGRAPLTPMRFRYTSHELSNSLLWPVQAARSRRCQLQGSLTRPTARRGALRPPTTSLPQASRRWRPRRGSRPSEARRAAGGAQWLANPAPSAALQHANAPRFVPIVRGVVGESRFAVSDSVTVRLATSGAGGARDCAAAIEATHRSAIATRARRGAAANMAEERGTGRATGGPAPPPPAPGG